MDIEIHDADREDYPQERDGRWYKSKKYGGMSADYTAYYRYDDTTLYILEHKGTYTLRYDDSIDVLTDPVLFEAKSLEAAMTLYKLSENNPLYSDL